MKKSSENNSKDQFDPKIIDKLYLEGEGVKSGELEEKKASFDETRELEGLKKVLQCWRDNHSEEVPSSAIRYKILQEAVKAKKAFSLKRFFLIPIRMPAIGIAVCVLMIFGFVTYKYLIMESPEKNDEDSKVAVSRKMDDKKVEDSLAMSRTETVLEKSVKEVFPEKAREEEDVMLADKTLEETSKEEVSKIIDEPNMQKRGEPLLDREDDNVLSQGAVRSAKEKYMRGKGFSNEGKPSHLSRTISGAKSVERKTAQRRRVSRGAGGLGKQGSKGYSGLPIEEPGAAPAGSHSRPQKKELVDQTSAVDNSKDAVFGGVDEKTKKKQQPDFFQKGILEQKRQNHVQAVKFFEKALEKATERTQKNRILLKLAESEIKKGNKKKAKITLAKIKDRKGWVGKEAQRLERKVQTRKAKKKPKQRKKSTSDQ